jgi:transcriptional regulator GlxA family with amidase domain
MPEPFRASLIQRDDESKNGPKPRESLARNGPAHSKKLHAGKAESLPRVVGGASVRIHSVEVLLCEGFDLFDLSAIVDTLRIAEKVALQRHFTISVMGLSGRTIRSSCGADIGADNSESRTAGRIDHLFVLAGDLSVESDLLARLDRLQGEYAQITLISADAVAVLAGKPWLSRHMPSQIGWTDGRLPLSRRLFHSFGLEGTLVQVLALINSLVGRTVAAKTADAMNCERLVSQDALRLHDLRRRLAFAPAPVGRTIRAMLDQPSDTRGFPEIAADAGISLRQLERLFREYLGVSPRELRKLCRLHRAHDAITTTGRPILEIAKANGFASDSHFTREFKRVFKQGPRAYRMRESSGREHVAISRPPNSEVGSARAAAE